MVENKQRHGVQRSRNKKIKRNMNKERNPVGRRGGGGCSAFWMQEQSNGKKLDNRVSMQKKHLNRLKLFRKDKGGICGKC